MQIWHLSVPGVILKGVTVVRKLTLPLSFQLHHHRVAAIITPETNPVCRRYCDQCTLDNLFLNILSHPLLKSQLPAEQENQVQSPIGVDSDF